MRTLLDHANVHTKGEGAQARKRLGALMPYVRVFPLGLILSFVEELKSIFPLPPNYMYGFPPQNN
jgi:hypothetical protein